MQWQFAQGGIGDRRGFGHLEQQAVFDQVIPHDVAGMLCRLSQAMRV